MNSPFYSQGLKFSCTRCSACCRGGPGYVFLSKPDLSRLLDLLSLDFHGFFHKYCTKVDTGLGMALSLAEKENYDCVFWASEGCTVYEARPIQCSSYPFWASVLESSRTWYDEKRACPGIDQGALRGPAEIEDRLVARRSEPTIVFPYGVDPETFYADSILGR
ncbi:MAG TPA: YkgJ family cysteine cluster protein [Rectinemataceae bacterium]|nr:YkgJ family cysteine cluster protein [Rectinemataceae bacterium]